MAKLFKDWCLITVWWFLELDITVMEERILSALYFHTLILQSDEILTAVEIAKRCRCTQPYAIKSLKSLTEKEILVKEEIWTDLGKRCKYTINPKLLMKYGYPSQQMINDIMGK